MLDVALIREKPEYVKEKIAFKKANPSLVDEFLKLDGEWRSLKLKTDELRAKLNALSKERKIEEAKVVKEELKSAEAGLPDLEKQRDEILDKLPNLPADNWPEGKDESENKVLREVGGKPKFKFPPQDYLIIAQKLGIIDVERAAKVSGSRFGYLMKEAALLEFALVQLAFNKLIKKGFTPVIPPVMIRPDVYKGMGRLAGSQTEERYYFPKDELYLVGSAEHTIGPIHADEVLDEKDLPRRYVGFSTCFRREAGSYGKDTKGILRVHQFDKVEMFSFSKPEDSEKEHKFLLECQEELMRELGLPYRVVQICTGDMGWTD
ncbi:MAG: aminoacyl--tRNA ligase-related protein, partial [Patescibacteria group bacterium]